MTEKKPFSIIPSVTNRVGKFTLSGYITPDKNSGAQITDAFDLLIADKACDVINLTLMNLYGGSVNEGIPSMNAIQNCPKPIVINTEGLIASMGISLLASAKGIHKVIGGKMSRYLIHKCGTSAEGNSDDLREAADMADGLEADMVQALSDKTGMTTDEIKTLWMP
jgi:ATP-dependent protease ClpP protease subunit